MKKQYNTNIDFSDPRLISAIEDLDIMELLDECGVEYSLEGRNIGSSFIGVETCLNCGKTNFHFGIHKEKLFGSCLVCKIYYSPLKLVSVLKKISLKEAFDYLIEDVELDLDVEERVRQILKPRRKEKEYSFRGVDELPENKPITKKIIDRNPLLKAFLKERRIKIWDVPKYDLRIGINEHKNKIIFPVHIDGKVVSYQWRRITRKQYHIPDNLAHYLLWEDEINCKPLILVEGFLDAYHLRSFVDTFYPNKFSVTTGFTKSISKWQIDVLTEKNPTELICMFDNDSWFDYFHRFKERFSFDVNYVILPKDSDPNSMTYMQLNKVFKEQIL